jgi:DNA-binding NarL/FixJ family response regulator
MQDVGLANREVARRSAHSGDRAQLFLSPRTVEWHLHKVFTKLGITSRMQLRDKLPVAARTGSPA